MPYNEIERAIYLLLEYFYQCFKLNTEPSLPEARAAAGDVNNNILGMALQFIENNGLCTRVGAILDFTGEYSCYMEASAKITAEGMLYLRENATMKAAAKNLGGVVDKVILPIITGAAESVINGVINK